LDKQFASLAIKLLYFMNSLVLWCLGMAGRLKQHAELVMLENFFLKVMILTPHLQLVCPH